MCSNATAAVVNLTRESSNRKRDYLLAGWPSPYWTKSGIEKLFVASVNGMEDSVKQSKGFEASLGGVAAWMPR
jgi:hypothetical protein